MGKLKVSDYMKKTPALKTIAEMLEKSFNEIGEKIRTDLIKAYRENADYWFNKFFETSKAENGDIIPRGTYGISPFHNWREYVEFQKKKGVSEYDLLANKIETWEDVRKAASRARVTYRYADQRAKDSYEGARDSFVYKNLGKMDEVLGKRSDLKNAVINFIWDKGGHYFKGNLQVYLQDAYFRGELDVKYVLRTIPRVTPYFQYPLIFTEAEIGKQHFNRPSEEELRNLLSGKTSEQHKAEKAAQALAEGYCPMSGKMIPSGAKGYGRYKTCPTCGASMPPTSSWLFPKHKTLKAQQESQKKTAAAKLAESGYCSMSRQKVPAEIVAAMGPVEGYKDPKAPCPACHQQVRLDARSEWIRDRFLTDQGYPTRMKVESATYYKHKLTK